MQICSVATGLNRYEVGPTDESAAFLGAHTRLISAGCSLPEGLGDPLLDSIQDEHVGSNQSPPSRDPDSHSGLLSWAWKREDPDSAVPRVSGLEGDVRIARLPVDGFSMRGRRENPRLS